MIRVLITGAGSVMGQSIYQALNKCSLSAEIEVVFTNSDDCGAGFYFNQQAHYKVPVTNTVIVPYAVDEGYIQSIEKIIEDESIDIVYSGTQHELYKIAEFNKGNCAVIPTQVMSLCLDKYETFLIFEKYGLSYPHSVRLSEVEDIQALPYPQVMKPATDSSSRNIFVIKDSAELESVIDGLDVPNDQMIVQDFLDGDEYTCGCYVDMYSHELSTIVFKRELTADGASGYGEIVHDETIEVYLQGVADMMMAEGLGFGHFNVQLRLVDGDPVCFEINPRLSSTESPKASFGYNSVEAYLVNIVKQQPYNMLEASSGRFIRYYEDVLMT